MIGGDIAVGCLAAYLLGSVPFGLIVARIVGGIDIREKGSGNIGATNVGRILGKKWGATVFILDFAKGFVPTFFFVSAVGGVCDMDGFTTNLARVLTGLSAILGHTFPVFLAFKGGKGVATSAGVLCALQWVVVVIAGVVWGAVVLSFRYVSLGSIVSAVSVPVVFVVLERETAFSENLPLTLFCCVLTVLVIVRHRSNIGRLIAGNENRVLSRKEGE